MAGGTDGNLIGYDGSGDPAAIATGTAGQVLTSGGTGVASAMAAAVGAWVLLSTTTISDDATIDFTLTNASYSDYMFILSDVVAASDAQQMWMRFSTDGGSTFLTSAYEHSGWGVDSIGTVEYNRSTSDSSIELVGSETAGDTLSNVAGETYHGVVMLYAPGSALDTHITFQVGNEQANNNHMTASGAGRHQTAQDTDAVQFLSSSGNLTSGTIKMLGLAT
jgi:hypothetical protein